MSGSDMNSLVCDSGWRKWINSHLINVQDEVQRAYKNFGPYQFHQDEYPSSNPQNHPRWF